LIPSLKVAPYSVKGTTKKSTTQIEPEPQLELPEECHCVDAVKSRELDIDLRVEKEEEELSTFDKLMTLVQLGEPE